MYRRSSAVSRQRAWVGNGHFSLFQREETKKGPAALATDPVDDAARVGRADQIAGTLQQILLARRFAADAPLFRAEQVPPDWYTNGISQLLASQFCPVAE